MHPASGIFDSSWLQTLSHSLQRIYKQKSNKICSQLNIHNLERFEDGRMIARHGILPREFTNSRPIIIPQLAHNCEHQIITIRLLPAWHLSLLVPFCLTLSTHCTKAVKIFGDLSTIIHSRNSSPGNRAWGNFALTFIEKVIPHASGVIMSAGRPVRHSYVIRTIPGRFFINDCR